MMLRCNSNAKMRVQTFLDAGGKVLRRPLPIGETLFVFFKIVCVF